MVLGRVLGAGNERLEHLGELSVAERNGLLKVPVLNRSRDGLGLKKRMGCQRVGEKLGQDVGGTHKLDGLGERVARDLVLDDANDVRRRLGLGLKDGLDGLDTLEGRENSVKRAGDTSALGVTERSDTGVKAEALGEDVLDVVRLDRIEVAVEGSLGDDDDRLALTDATMTLEDTTHLILPIVRVWRLLGDEDKVGSGAEEDARVSVRRAGNRVRGPNSRDSSKESEPTTVAAHDLNDEGSRVGGGGGGDGVDGLADAVESGKTTDGEVRHRHVVVDGSDETDDVEVGMGGRLKLGDLAWKERDQTSAPPPCITTR